MADDGVTSEQANDEPSEDELESADESEDADDADESDEEDSGADASDDSDDSEEQAESADADDDVEKCEECGSPMTSEVRDFQRIPGSKWAGMGAAGEPEYAAVCSNEDCPTRENV
jgi:hypothetical protein